MVASLRSSDSRETNELPWVLCIQSEEHFVQSHLLFLLIVLRSRLVSLLMIRGLFYVHVLCVLHPLSNFEKRCHTIKVKKNPASVI